MRHHRHAAGLHAGVASLAAAGVSRVGTVGEVALVRCADRVVVSWGRPGVWLRFWGYGWG